MSSRRHKNISDEVDNIMEHVMNEILFHTIFTYVCAVITTRCD